MILYGHESSMIWSMNRCKIPKWTRTDAHLNTMQTLESMISSINTFLNSHSFTQKGMLHSSHERFCATKRCSSAKGWTFLLSRLFWLMTFLFLLPLIYTVLGSVIVAIKTAKSCNHSMKIKARDERVGLSLCWTSPLGSDILKTWYIIRF